VTTLETTCRICGRVYDIDRADLVRGPDHWRRCPECRKPDTDTPEADTGSDAMRTRGRSPPASRLPEPMP
jgi:hypothetical protein